MLVAEILSKGPQPENKANILVTARITDTDTGVVYDEVNGKPLQAFGNTIDDAWIADWLDKVKQSLTEQAAAFPGITLGVVETARLPITPQQEFGIAIRKLASLRNLVDFGIKSAQADLDAAIAAADKLYQTGF